MKFNETKDFLRIPVIYGIKNTITGKWYIGSCVDMKDRFQRHRYYLLHNAHHSDKLQRSFNKYGIDNFEICILKYLSTEEELKNRWQIEESFIKDYNSVKDGYNILDKCQDYSKFNMPEEGLKNFKTYLQTRQKRVISFDRVTGEMEHTFESVIAAAKYYNTSSSNVSRVCKGSLNYIKDKVFIYEENFDPTKSYKVEHHMKGVSKPASQIEKMRRNSCRNRPIYKYDENYNLITSYISRAEAERCNGFRKEGLRRILDKNINGFIYSEIQR